MTYHHHAMKEVQFIGATIEQKLETFSITIDNCDENEFVAIIYKDGIPYPMEKKIKAN